MTEAEAYKVVGWAPEGGAPSLLVLPLSNSDRTDWVAGGCLRCGAKSVSVPEAAGDQCPCPCCGSALVNWAFKSEDRI